MKNFIKFQFIAILACIFAFYSCDIIPTTTKIPVQSLTIELDDITVDENGTKSTLNYFNVTQTVYRDSIKGITDEIFDYLDQLESVEVESATLTIISTDDEGTVVEEFTIKVDKLSDFVIAEYVLGTPYPYSNELENYFGQLLMKVLLNKSTEFNISGKTDVPSGKKLKIIITLDDITLEAKLLDS